MKIGFTGTRYGMTWKQAEALTETLVSATEFHHGDCLGADMEAHLLALSMPEPPFVVIHPPKVATHRAFCGLQGMPGRILNNKDYLSRNQAIVDATDLLVACPSSDYNVLRSGTWATIRYAKKVGKKVLLITRWEGERNLIRPDG